jgi:nucleotide-binding universal stress UspA family protein
MFREIMVALESVEIDQPALAAAVTLAKRSAARLHVVHVSNSSGSKPEALERSALFRTIEWTSDELNESVSFQLIEPEIGKTIAAHLIEYATAHAIDLIIMGTHARGRIGRTIYGSAVEGIIRACNVPVLVVPRVPQRLKLRRLLVALDGTAEAEAILDEAAELARLFGSTITLLQVVDAAGAEDNQNSHPLAHEQFVLRCAHSEEYLDRTADRLREHGISVHTATVAGSRVATLLKHAADANHADLVALAPRKRRKGRWPSRVTPGLLHHASTAVLLHPRGETKTVHA